ncbi:MAG: nitrile hydratase subunit beta [Nitrosarchaeum sp.]|nr:nitrile hydratase subunit beta [Nitrosarchaeum sp.]
MEGVSQIRKFRVADTVKVIFSSKARGSDIKRSPMYHEGMVGVIKRVHGFISIPPDHTKRPAYYQVAFDANQISPKASSKEKIYLEVFEDWLERVPRSEL